MTVTELIEILKSCDQSLPVATLANNHDYFSKSDGISHGCLRVVLCHHYGGDHVMIGNVGRTALNPPNWYVTAILDGGPRIHKNYPTWDGNHWDFSHSDDTWEKDYHEGSK